MNVLIADDNDNCIQMLQEVLSLFPDVHTTAAENGCEAWWHLSNPGQVFDLVITDVKMPMVSGLQLIQRMRSYPDLKHIHVILSTGLHDRKTVEVFKELGIVHYVVKPYTRDTMLERIKLVLSSPG
ncbi:MAG TPA: response regulator [Rariglobus sp.]|nr:response regulator [Rariglobus sp.]